MIKIISDNGSYSIRPAEFEGIIRRKSTIESPGIHTRVYKTHTGRFITIQEIGE